MRWPLTRTSLKTLHRSSTRRHGTIKCVVIQVNDSFPLTPPPSPDWLQPASGELLPSLTPRSAPERSGPLLASLLKTGNQLVIVELSAHCMPILQELSSLYSSFLPFQRSVSSMRFPMSQKKKKKKRFFVLISHSYSPCYMALVIMSVHILLSQAQLILFCYIPFYFCCWYMCE